MQFLKVVRPDILSMGKSFMFSLTSAVRFWEITSLLHTRWISNFYVYGTSRQQAKDLDGEQLINPNMLKYVKAQTILPSFLKEHQQQTFYFGGLWQPLWKQWEEFFREEGHFIVQSPHIRSWQSGKENRGSNLFLLKSTIYVHQRNKSFNTVTFCLINIKGCLPISHLIKQSKWRELAFLTEFLLIIS